MFSSNSAVFALTVEREVIVFVISAKPSSTLTATQRPLILDIESGDCFVRTETDAALRDLV